MKVTVDSAPTLRQLLDGPEKGISRIWTSYHDSSLERSVGYRAAEGAVETATQALPFKLVAIVDLDRGGGHLAKVTMIVDRFGQEEDDSLRVGVRSVHAEVEDGQDLVSLWPEDLRRVPVHQLLLVAVLSWSHNSDKSPVTVAQARALTKRGATKVRTAEETWRGVADVYLAAQAAGKPTTAEVAAYVGHGTSKESRANTRALIRRVRLAGYLPPVEKSRS